MEFGRTKSRAERMIDNYAARLKTGQCGAAMNIGLKGPAERYAAAMARTREIRAKTLAVLDELGAPAALRLFYCAFASRLGKIARAAWGEHARRAEARILLMTWQARGLDPGTMKRIAKAVFELELEDR